MNSDAQNQIAAFYMFKQTYQLMFKSILKDVFDEEKVMENLDRQLTRKSRT